MTSTSKRVTKSITNARGPGRAMAWRVLSLSCAVGVVACGRPQKTLPTTAVVPAAPSSALRLAASASATPSPSSPFSVVGRFANGVEVRLHALGDRPAVWQRERGGAWSLSVLGRDGLIVDLTAKLARGPTGTDGDLLTVAGDTPESAFVSTYFVTAEGAMQFDMSTWQLAAGKAPTRLAFVGFRAMGALHDGHWVGLPFAVHPGYLIDDPPQKFQTFRGKGSLPTIPPKLSLYDVAFLGAGKVCGLGGVVGEHDSLQTLLWTDNGRTFPVESATDRARVVRGAAGECVLVTPGKNGTTFKRTRGESLTSVEIRRRASAVSASEDGAIWLLDEDNGAVVRVRLREDAADETVFALPAQGECKPVPGSIVAFSATDAWLTAGCRNASQMLFHTQQAPANIDAWKAPPAAAEP